MWCHPEARSAEGSLQVEGEPCVRLRGKEILRCAQDGSLHIRLSPIAYRRSPIAYRPLTSPYSPPVPHAKKRLGQHFLSDPGILGRIADALEIAPGDCVLEIGPGLGGLTAQLATRAERLIAPQAERLRRRLVGSGARPSRAGAR